MADRVDGAERKTDYKAIRNEAEAEIKSEFGSEETIESELDELEDLEDEVGLQEVYLNEQEIDTIPADDTDDNLDADDDGIEDSADSEESISDLPQEVTESYGTGLQGQPSDRAGRYSRRESHLQNKHDYALTGGDVYANDEDADAVGEEGVGGTVATPDQNVVEDLAVAVGLEMDDRVFLRTNDVLEERDDRRWELDPKSSEDYQDRRD